MRLTKKLIEEYAGRYLKDLKQGWPLPVHITSLVTYVWAEWADYERSKAFHPKYHTIVKKLRNMGFEVEPEEKWPKKHLIRFYYCRFQKVPSLEVEYDNGTYDFLYHGCVLRSTSNVSSRDMTFFKYFSNHVLYFERLYQRAKIEYRKYLAEERNEAYKKTD